MKVMEGGRCVGEMWGDVGRCGEMCGEMWGDLPTWSVTPLATSICSRLWRTPTVGEDSQRWAWKAVEGGVVGRYGELWGDMGDGLPVPHGVFEPRRRGEAGGGGEGRRLKGHHDLEGDIVRLALDGNGEDLGGGGRGAAAGGGWHGGAIGGAARHLGGELDILGTDEFGGGHLDDVPAICGKWGRQ